MPTNRDIVNYYDFSKLEYQLYSGSFNDISMRFGIWDETTTTHKQALQNENRVIAEAAAIDARDYVLDVGCGYGTTAVWLATHVGCHVCGITLGERQAESARRFAKSRNVAHLTSFSAMDFHDISFTNDAFDVAVAIESICHSSDKPTVLKEIYRILKPSGRLAIADGYFNKNPLRLNPTEAAIARSCFEGVHVPPLPERRQFWQWLAAAGFYNIQWIDKTESILPTSHLAHRFGKTLMPAGRVLNWLGARALSPSHLRAFVDQYYAFRDGLGAYGIFTARKCSSNETALAKMTLVN
jgi:tocopherol O-methyltransferase